MHDIQEINVFMKNGDVAAAILHDLGGQQYRADFDYRKQVGPKLDPHEGPVASAAVAFDHMIGTLVRIAEVFGTQIDRVSNPCNAIILSVPQQEAILSARSITAPVDLNSEG